MPKDAYSTNSLLKKSRPSAEAVSSRSYLITENKLTSVSGQKRSFVPDSPEKVRADDQSGGTRGFGSSLRRALKIQVLAQNKIVPQKMLKKKDSISKRSSDNVDFSNSDLVAKTQRYENIGVQSSTRTSNLQGFNHISESRQTTRMVCEKESPELVRIQPRRPVFANKEWIQRNRQQTDIVTDAADTMPRAPAPNEIVEIFKPSDVSIPLYGSCEQVLSGDSAPRMEVIGPAAAVHSAVVAPAFANDFPVSYRTGSSGSANYVRRNLKSRGTSRRKPRRRVDVEREREARSRALSDDDGLPGNIDQTASAGANSSARAAVVSSSWTSLGLDPLQISLDLLNDRAAARNSKPSGNRKSGSTGKGERSSRLPQRSAVSRDAVAPTSLQREKKITQIRGVSQPAINVSVAQPPLCSGHQMTATLLAVKKSGSNKVRFASHAIIQYKLVSGTWLLCLFIPPGPAM
jgi:hypothetical protein